MKINYKEKIEQINNDRILMLQITKDSISKNKMILADNLDAIVSVFNVDEQNVKEYKTILQAKQLILELTEEISMATSVDEIISLRKKINYYISKIKKEITKRNINQELFDKMYNKVLHLRKDISTYIRFLKRENNILEIMSLYQNIDSLSTESKTRLKQLLNNEKKYNKRFFKSVYSTEENNIIVEDKLKDENTTIECSKELGIEQEQQNEDVLPFVNSFNIQDDEIATESTLQQDSQSLVEDKLKDENTIIEFGKELGIEQEQQNEDVLPFVNSFNIQDDEIATESTLQQDSQSLVEDFLANRIGNYVSQYNFNKLLCYDNSFFKNFIRFLRNIPRYGWNKKIIKLIEYDYNTFYHGQDLGAFIDYSKKRNSIKTALTIIFRNSHLSNREIECLNNHSKCKEWIIEFYNKYSDICEYSNFLARTK